MYTTTSAAPTTTATLAQPASVSSSAAHIRRSCLPHHALLPDVQCIIHSLHRPTKSLEDLFRRATLQDEMEEIENEIHVTATAYGFGIPMHPHAAGSSTRSGRAVARYEDSREEHSARIFDKRRKNIKALRNPKDISWEEMLELPIRWKDLSRDACIAFNVIGPSGEQLWGTTLSLFDSNGLLRNGKLKLQLYPHTKAHPYVGPKVCRTPGLAFFMPSKMNASVLISRLREQQQQENAPQQQPNSSQQQQQQQQRPGLGGVYYTNDDLRSEWWNPYHVSWKPDEEEGYDHGYSLAHEAVDYKWKASLILEQLESKYKTVTPNTLLDTLGKQRQPGGNDVATNGSSSSGTYWLDNFTMERCRQMVSGTHASNGGNRGASRDDDEFNDDDELYASLLNPGTPEYVLATNSYLIVELPIFPLPVVHEEPFYPHAIHGASGSVTALDLALHRRHVAALAAAERAASAQGPKTGGNGTLKESPQIALLKSKVAEEQDAGISLVQFLDFETDDINPVEDKYRALAHDLLRGVVDPTVKPDKEQRARLMSIIASPSHHLTREEKDLLWRFRFSLVDNRKALTKFLLAVDWTEDDEVVQAAELLEQWRKRSPIEVTDALKLLGKHVAFQTSLVRSYAIDTLANAPDDELQLYLLQLVQALKYEEITIDDTYRRNGGVGNSNSSTPSSGRAGIGSNVSGSAIGVAPFSSLAVFLIERASKSISLANYMYWYLKVEMEDANNRERYGIVFASLRERLSLVFAHGADVACEGSAPSSHHPAHRQGTSFSSIIENVTNKLGSSIKNFGGDDDTSSFFPKNLSMWDRLLLQDQFITGIMECQMESRELRGKKDAKEKKLQELLSERGFQNIRNNESVPLPSAPQLMVCGVNPGESRMFKSALYPAVLEFKLREIPDKNAHGEKKNLSSDDTREYSPRGGSKCAHELTYQVMVKTGDDLRQDQLVIMMVRLMDGLLKRGALDLCLRSYSILATSTTSGLVEFVSGSIPISQILATNNGSILHFFQKVAPAKAKYNVQPNVLETYIRSCAGFCVISFLLGIGDRHLDNIMLLPSGHFFHIDFGFILGRDPKPLPPPFRLTREMVDGMGGIDSPEYNRFCSLACQAYNTLRKHAGLVLNLLHLMSDAGIADLSNNPIADAEGVIAKVADRFRLELSDEQAESFFLGLINESLAALAPRVMEVFHQLSVARR